ncbi:MAG: hypothetical protein ACLUB8_05185 [Limosilactobacillus vaginalis]|uniref:Uncharacterized protein n=1 Tax=Limosilactobacillus vaginalis TaxID=1633 RepID=A0AAW5WUX4_9LACO|nr:MULTISPECIES: hypothetical protein [Limosilactobacillus]MCI7720393.1 hypothetical protein [Limosilactobacillus reuteri]MCZ3668089.1 hypothetical protein [Limosilactobacillus vaginalis]MDY4865276.1 hypothetical protein [Limosilactobacillus sp.]
MNNIPTFIPQKENPRKTLNNIFSLQERVNINQAISLGYSEVMKDSEKLKWYSANYDKGVLSRMRSLSVIYFLRLLVLNGKLPVKFSIEKNKQGNAKYILGSALDGSFCFTVNQTQTYSKSSPKAQYRADRHCAFQSYFDFGLDGSDNLITNKPLYFELNHGYRGLEPKFIVLGIPDNNQGWYAVDNILQSTPLQIKESNNKMTNENAIQDYNWEDFENFILGKGEI